MSAVVNYPFKMEYSNSYCQQVLDSSEKVEPQLWKQDLYANDALKLIFPPPHGTPWSRKTKTDDPACYPHFHLDASVLSKAFEEIKATSQQSGNCDSISFSLRSSGKCGCGYTEISLTNPGITSVESTSASPEDFIQTIYKKYGVKVRQMNVCGSAKQQEFTTQELSGRLIKRALYHTPRFEVANMIVALITRY